ncbi:MAG: VWA domain-containing protein [Bdellovibrionales bacterium]|nr:VWA domain-containing protein [Bdellovibrionales bacterium]
MKNLILSLLVLSNFANAQDPVPAPTVATKSIYQSIEYSNIDLEKALPPKVIILLDSSGSMGQLMDKQKSKMFYAKKLFGSYLADQWREKADVGLLVYGGRRKKDCEDFFMAVPVGERSLPKIDNAVKALSPTGMTPIAKSLELAIDQLKGYAGPKRIMIFTDGEETCGGDSCKILEKAIQSKVVDLEMFVTGIGMKGDSKDLDKLRCLGKVFGAPNPQSMQNALNNINNEIKKSAFKQSGPNLFVQSPDPKVEVRVYKTVNGERAFVKTFIANAGVSLEPGEYSVDVMLDPVFRFSKVVIPPKRKVTLKVTGTGILTVKFFDGLLEVELLNKDKKVVQHFLSDEPHTIPSGEYDVRIFGEPFYEYVEKKFKIIPGGNHEIKIEGVGVVQVDYPSTVGIHVYNGSDAHIGNYVSNFPFVLKTGGYRFYINDQCNIEGISVRNDHFLQRLPCPLKK